MKKLLCLSMILLLVLGSIACDNKPQQIEQPPVQPEQNPTDPPELVQIAPMTQEPTLTPEPATPEPTNTPEPTATPEPTFTPEPTATPEPEGKAASVKADGVGLIASILSKNDSLTVIGEQGDYYRVELAGQTLLVEKRLLRLEGEAAYESKTAYAQRNALLFDNVYMKGEERHTLPINRVVTVLEELGGVYLVEYRDAYYYVRSKQISFKKLSTGGGGSSSNGQDGGDIELANPLAPAGTIKLASIQRDTVSYPINATVLADKVEAYYILLNRGDSLKLIDTVKPHYQIIAQGIFGLGETRLIQDDTKAPYAQWDGYAKNKTVLYGDHRTLKELKELKVNTKIHVVADIETCYVVEVNGSLGYILKSSVSKTKVSTGGGGGGNSGGDWTDPKL